MRGLKFRAARARPFRFDQAPPPLFRVALQFQELFHATSLHLAGRRVKLRGTCKNVTRLDKYCGTYHVSQSTRYNRPYFLRPLFLLRFIPRAVYSKFKANAARTLAISSASVIRLYNCTVGEKICLRPEQMWSNRLDRCCHENNVG